MEEAAATAAIVAGGEGGREDLSVLRAAPGPTTRAPARLGAWLTRCYALVSRQPPALTLLRPDHEPATVYTSTQLKDTSHAFGIT